MSHPLDEEFGFTGFDDDVVVDISSPDLDLIINLALSAYKQHYEMMGMIEPKSRLKFLEICERFLAQAKDAMYKKEQIKLQIDKQKKAKVVGNATVLVEDQAVGLISRDAMYD